MMTSNELHSNEDSKDMLIVSVSIAIVFLRQTGVRRQTRQEQNKGISVSQIS